jgi:Family of unknown function (DUF6338)
MPTTLSGLFLFVVLLLPGFAYVVGRERHTSGQKFSAFRESAVVVAASVTAELLILLIFTVVRVLLPSLTPNVGALVRDSNRYLRGSGSQPGHYGQVAIWAVAMLALSVALAYSASIPWVRSKLRVGAVGEYPHESIVSAWWKLFDTWAPEGTGVRVRCFLTDGSYVEGEVGSFSREADDITERDLILVEPISFRPPGGSDIEAYETSALCISAGSIVTMFVTYWQEPEITSPPASPAGAAEAASPASISAAVAELGPSGPSEVPRPPNPEPGAPR